MSRSGKRRTSDAKMNVRSKTRFAVWGAVTGLACGVCLTPGAVVLLPGLRGETGALIAAILAAGALGAIVGFSVAMMKDGSGEL
jgi:hypothetical protein